jgi:uncharacterized protein (TIGR02147 family)
MAELDSKPHPDDFPLLPHSGDFRLFLQGEYARRCRKNQRYNLSAFARFLEMDISTLAKILKGQRVARGRLIHRIGLKLGLSPTQLEEFTQASPRANSKSKIEMQLPEYRQVTLDTFQMISDWYHYALLELILHPQFRPDIAWIARTLKISPTEVQIAAERLVRLKMMEITPDGKWLDRSGGFTTTLGNHFTTSAFKNLQRQVLKKAADAMDEVPFEKRSQTSTTMIVHPERIPEAKKMIVEFQRKLNRFLGEGERTATAEVYHLGLSLYPVSFSQETLREDGGNA